MPTFYESGTVTVTFSLAYGDDYVLTESGVFQGASLIGTSGDNQVLVHGDIYGGGITLGSAGGGSTDENFVFVGDTGSITAFSGGAVRLSTVFNTLINYGQISVASDFSTSPIVTMVGTNNLYNGGTISAFDDNAVRLSSTTSSTTNLTEIVNDGTIHAARNVGIYLLQASLDLVNNGTISSGTTAISLFDATDTAVMNISNYGAIQGDSYAILNSNNFAGHTIFNAGTITGEIQLYLGDDTLSTTAGSIIEGIVDDGGGAFTFNHDGALYGLLDLDSSGDKTVSIGETGLIVGDATFGSGTDTLDNAGRIDGAVSFSSGIKTVTNSGEITGGIDFGAGNFTLTTLAGSVITGGVVDGATSTLIHDGVIYGGFTAGASSVQMITIGTSGLIDGNVTLQSGTDTLINAGTIRGAVDMGGDLDVLRNTGTIIGDVDMGTGFDTLRNSGSIDGDVVLGLNDDTFRGVGGSVTGVIDGGDGADSFYVDQADAVIIGGTGSDTVYGSADVLDTTGVEEIILMGSADLSAIGDADTTYMQGNLGRNELTGADGAQTFAAGGGDDVVRGEAGNDTLRGNAGSDLLEGGAEDDLILGGIGDDTVVGGLGRDVLYGQQGADVFVLNTIGESLVGASRDLIVDFVRGTDVIDVSAINQEAFAFIGTGAFSGSGGMELRYTVLAGTEHALVQMDSDGDGVVDSELLVRGNPVLTADDFVL